MLNFLCALTSAHSLYFTIKMIKSFNRNLHKITRSLNDLNGYDNAHNVFALAVLELVFHIDVHFWIKLQDGERGVITVDSVFHQRTFETRIETCIGVGEFEWDINACKLI